MSITESLMAQAHNAFSSGSHTPTWSSKIVSSRLTLKNCSIEWWISPRSAGT